MKNITPYLKSLKAFETAARHQSFSAAANELNVTPAAVGQLVKSLENQLDITLFHRQVGGSARLVLTDTAKAALPDIQAGFERLQRGINHLKTKDNFILTVTTSPVFAAKWLLIRLPEFQHICPQTSIRLHTDTSVLDFAANEIDVGIRYGSGDWDGLTAEKLFDEEIFPVCSPAWLANHPITAPGELLGAMLIHDVSFANDARFTSWQQWLNHANVPVVMLKAGLNINQTAAVLQAAADGMGVALGRSVLAADDLASGRLVRLFPEISYPSELAYYLVYPKGGQSAALGRFREWIFGVQVG